MIDPKKIPDAVVEAAAIALHSRWVIMNVQDGGDQLDYERWEGLEEDERHGWRQEATASICAALKAWPGVNLDAERCGTIILHLPKDKADA